jgi:hypothetical protein
MRLKFLSGALFLMFNVASGQVLNMQVLSGKSKEAVPLVNIMLLPSNQTTVADLDGNFSITCSTENDTLVAMGIGFELFKKPVADLIGKKTLVLKEESIVLESVEIKVEKRKRRRRKVDPAYLLHKAIVDHSLTNDFKGNASYSCKTYNRVEVDVNNVTDKTRGVLIFRPIDFLFDDIDSTSLPKKFVPVLFSEVVSDYYKGDEGKKEIVKGSKVSGLEIQSLAQFTGNMYLGYNIYDNYLNLFQKSFVSPLATNSWLTYNFYLTDSIQEGDTTLYKLEFIPRRQNELAFKGQLWTDNKSFAIHDIHLQLLKTANVNYISQFEIDLKYSYRDSVWMLDTEKILMDVYLTDNTYGFYVKKHTSYLDYKYPVEYPEDYFNLSERVGIWDSIAEHGDDAIAEVRAIANDSSTSSIYSKMDSVMNTGYIKRVKSLAKMYYTGYFPFKYVELGPYYSLYSYNEIEGSRFRLGGATMTNLLPKTQVFGHLARGSKDLKYKGQLRLTHFFNLKNWRYLRFGYYDDYTILSSSTNSFATDNILASLARRVSPRFTHIKRYSGQWFHSWFSGLENYINLNWEELRPIGSLVYQQLDMSSLSLIRMNTVKFGGRIALQEKFAYSGFRRFSFSTRKPILNYGFTQGVVLNGEGYEFSKLELEFIDRYYLGFLGYLKVVASAGKVWGKLPYPMLLNHTGNDSYYYDSKAFNLMNPFEFVSDEQVTLMLSHHFNGVIMNQVPLFKRLHWRSFVFARGSIGRLSDRHEEVVVLPEGLTELRDPYVEVGAGMENVFRVIRVDFLWRLTNIGPDTQVFGINFAVQPRL